MLSERRKKIIQNVINCRYDRSFKFIIYFFKTDMKKNQKFIVNEKKKYIYFRNFNYRDLFDRYERNNKNIYNF